MKCKCTRCLEDANIKINILNYCKSCFQTSLLSKVQKHLHKFRSGSKTLIYLPKSSFSNMFYEILGNFFTENNRFDIVMIYDTVESNKFVQIKQIKITDLEENR